MAILDNDPRTYQARAEDYYERPVDLAAVAHVYAHRPLSRPLVKKLNPKMSLRQLAEDLKEIGYGQSASDA